jgi:hypothetical protein
MTFLKSMAGALLASTIFVACPASAATLVGNRVGIQYIFPDLGTVYESLPANLVGTSGPTTGVAGGIFSLSFTDSSVTASAFQFPSSWTSSSFNGFRLYDIDGTIAAFTGVTLGATNMAGLTNANISFDANNIYVNWAALSFDTATTATFNISAGSGVPEPAAWAMMLAGFGFVGASMRRRQKISVSYA